jgi:hypothetical protein
MTCLLNLRGRQVAVFRICISITSCLSSQGPKHVNAAAHFRRPCPEEYSHCQNVEQRTDSLTVRAMSADDWERPTLRREHLLMMMGSYCRNWRLENWNEKTSATGSPCTSYWVQLKSPIVRDERAYTASASRLM